MVDNPYRAPTAILTDGPKDLERYSTVQLRGLYNHGRSIRTLGVLWVVGGIWSYFMVFALFRMETLTLVMGLFFGLIGLIQMVTGSAVFSFRAWSRIPGFLLCVLMLIGFPIGTLFGILGLVAFSKGGILFTPDLDFKQVKQEYKYRRRHKIP